MNAKVIQFPTCADLSRQPKTGWSRLWSLLAGVFRKPKVIEPKRRASRATLIVGRAMRDWK